MTIQIRKMKLQDIEQVLKLCDQIREYHRNILDGYFTHQDDELEKEILLESLHSDDKLPLVAVDENEIVGVLLAEKRNTPWLENSKIAHIFNFGVVEEARGKGIAKLMMDSFFAECKKEDIKEIKLGVFNKNTIAYNFYQKYGFEPQEQRMSLKVK